MSTQSFHEAITDSEMSPEQKVEQLQKSVEHYKYGRQESLLN
jgi:hypothetical protein